MVIIDLLQYCSNESHELEIEELGDFFAGEDENKRFYLNLVIELIYEKNLIRFKEKIDYYFNSIPNEFKDETTRHMYDSFKRAVAQKC